MAEQYGIGPSRPRGAPEVLPAGARPALAAVVLAALVAVPAPVRAQPAPEAGEAAEGDRVLVLGIRSLEGDDAVAHAITEALVTQATDRPGWQVGERKVSLAQMMLVHRCDEADARCMAGVAASLHVDRLLYGILRRTGVGERYDFALTLHQFDAGAGEIVHSLSTELPRDAAMNRARELAPRWVARLAGQAPTGALRVAVNVPGAQVRVDGEAVGNVDAEAGLVRAEVPAGRHRVEVGAEGYGTFRGTVSVVPDEEASIEVELEERAGGPLAAPATTPPEERIVYKSRVTWPTYVAFGSAAAFLGVSIFAIVRVGNLKDDPALDRFGDPDSSFSESCNFARLADPSMNPSEAVDVCEKVDRLSPVRWIFLALGVGAAGAGGYLLYRDLSSTRRPADQIGTGPVPHLSGHAGLDGGRVTATWRF